MNVTASIPWLRVADLERSRAFYEQGFGMELLIDQGDCLLLGTGGGVYLGLCKRPDPRETPGLLLCFIDEDIEARTELLVECGAILEQPVQRNETYSIVHSFLRDPDGHRLEIQRFLDPEWHRPVR